MVRRVVIGIIRVVIAAIALPILSAIALAAREAAMRSQRGRHRPRLVYGPTPIHTIRYMSRAMRQLGYAADTVVFSLYRIHERTDFDFVYDDAWRSSSQVAAPVRIFRRLFGDYVLFARLLRRYDVFHFFFDAGFLHRTPLASVELQLLHLAGRRIVAMPYGSDVALTTDIMSLEWRHGLARNYPAIGRTGPARRARVAYVAEHADYVVGGLVHVETLPRWDLLPILYYPIDTDEWSGGSSSGADGHDGVVSVVHAPNHRGMKGTSFVIEACDRLVRSGLRVRLVLLEGMPNSAVRLAMQDADIVVDQLLLGYALTALEGMSLGKPVVSNLSDARYYDVFRHETRFSTCPVVSAGPDSIDAVLKDLVEHPDKRARLGEAGRAFAEREHSYAAMGELWSAVYARVWWGDDTDPQALVAPDRPPGVGGDTDRVERASALT
jgi:glycosyltransferase involved in cell wall biosynthesis